MKGPQGLISEALAGALAEFFVIDPKEIQTNLLKNAGIALQHVALKELKVSLSSEHYVVINGQVDSVAFTWQWGSDGSRDGSPFVKKVQLLIEGSRFTAQVQRGNIDQEQKQNKNTNGKNKNNDSASQHSQSSKQKKQGIDAFIEDQVQRIVDSLTLRLSNFTFTLTLPKHQPQSQSKQSFLFPGTTETRSLIFGATLFEIKSSAGHPMTQYVVLKGFFANISLSQFANRPPQTLLAPIDYMATCLRYGGKRLVDPIDQGLEVTGQSSERGFELHIGLVQLQFINDLLGIVLKADHVIDEEALKALKEGQGETDSSNQEPKTRPPLQKKREDANTKESTEMKETMVSTFNLPLAAVSLVLPNGTDISLSNLMLVYKMDGSQLTVTGDTGILVNGFPAVGLSHGSVWIADLVKSSVRFDHQDGTDVVAAVHIRDKELEPLLLDINDALAIYGGIKFEGGLAELEDGRTKPVNEQTAIQAWTFDVSGKILIKYEGASNAKGTLDGLHMVIAEEIEVKLDSIDSFEATGVAQLTQPLVDTKVFFDGSTVKVVALELAVLLTDEIQEEGPPENTTSLTVFIDDISKDLKQSSSTLSDVQPTEPLFILPYCVDASIEKITLSQNDEQDIIFETLKVIGSPGDKETGAIMTATTFAKLDNEMVKIENANIGALVHTNDFDKIDNLTFASDRIVVAAGYSVLDWLSLFRKPATVEDTGKGAAKDAPKKGKTTKNALKLPYAQIGSLKVKVTVDGVVGMKESVIRMGKFKGNKKTTTDEIIRFYSSSMIAKVPGIVTNTEILDVNLVDAVASQYGAVVGSSVLGGAAGAAGGVLAVAGFDSIKNTVQSGKKARGAEPDDRWKFTDIGLGLVYAAKHAAKGGAAKRGKDEENANLIDWTVGASAEIGDYTKENKSRLGGAGVGTVGFLVGLSVAGPIGAIAAGIVTSAVATKTIDHVDHQLSNGGKDENNEEENKNEEINGTPDDANENENENEERNDTPDVAKDTKNVAKHPITGILSKKGRLRQGWQPMYFVLEIDELSSYVILDKPPKGTPNDGSGMYINENKPKQKLSLRRAEVGINDELSDDEGGQYAFTIRWKKWNEGDWILGAPTELDRTLWMERILQSCK